MRINELRRKKVQVVTDPVEQAWTDLETFKERGSTARPNGTLQMFVPRAVERFFTKKEREDYVLKNNAAYAYDDEGKVVPHYQTWIDQATESRNPGPPIIAGGSPVIPGGSKPSGATLWTSTARQLPNKKWTSAWNELMINRGWGIQGVENKSKIGYLYKVKPQTCSYVMNDSYDAARIYKIFATLERSNTALEDPEKWERYKTFNSPETALIQSDFPWPEMQKHFDCMYHNGYRVGDFDFSSFVRGYDVESTAWFKPNQLEFLGQVPLQCKEDEEEDSY